MSFLSSVLADSKSPLSSNAGNAAIRLGCWANDFFDLPKVLNSRFEKQAGYQRICREGMRNDLEVC